MKLSRVGAAGAAILTASLLANAVSKAAVKAVEERTTPSVSASSRAPSHDLIFYSLGVLLSQNLDSFGLSGHEFRRVQQGFIDGFRHRANVRDAASLIPFLHRVQHQRQQVLIQHQKEAGAAFLAKAAASPGARRTSSGLVYLSAVQGTGPVPKPTDSVRIQYTGELIDGTVFDSSQRHGASLTVPLTDIIPCWREALEYMNVGGEARVVCPSDLAYGDYGHPPTIPRGATLDFRIKLLAVMPAAATGRAAVKQLRPGPTGPAAPAPSRHCGPARSRSSAGCPGRG